MDKRVKSVTNRRSAGEHAQKFLRKSVNFTISVQKKICYTERKIDGFDLSEQREEMEDETVV